jgi:hypothetical protein
MTPERPAARISCPSELPLYQPRKWFSRVGRRPQSREPLTQFVLRKGGINECAARFTRRLGQGAVTRKVKALTAAGHGLSINAVNPEPRLT